MKLADLLKKKRDPILKSWIDKIISSYPSDTSKHLKDQHDQFRNPVGHTIKTETTTLFDALVDGAEIDQLANCLDNLIKIKAVQDYAPRQALAFVFLLKNAVREILDRAELDKRAEELREFESQIDGLALILFDRYVECKVRMYEIRAREAHMRTAQLVEQVNRRPLEPVPTDKESNV